MQAPSAQADTTVTTLVPALPLSAWRRALVDPFVVPVLQPTSRSRTTADRRASTDRRQLRAQWPERLNRRELDRRDVDRRANDLQRRARAAGANESEVRPAAPRKGLIVDVYV